MNRYTYVGLFLIAGAVIGTVIFDKAFASLLASMSVANQSLVGDRFTLSTAAGMVTAVLICVVAWMRPKSKEFMAESIDELGKVSWPESSETKMNTVVVIVFAFIAAGILGVFDSTFGWLTNNNFFLF